MRLAILCPGPSVARTWGDADRRVYQLVIAVNAAARMGCDWWQAHDLETFERHSAEAEVHVGICTWSRLYAAYCDGRFQLRRGLWWFDAEALPSAGFRYHCLSMLGAMGLAVHLGASAVDLYGCDWMAPGYEATPGDHHDWPKHRDYYDACCAAWPQVQFQGVLP